MISKKLIFIFFILLLSNNLFSKEVKILFSSQKNNNLEFIKNAQGQFAVNDNFLNEICQKYDLVKVRKLRLRHILKNYDLFEVTFLTAEINQLISFKQE
ncbi:hypothetical protein ACX8XP_03780 [Calditrichota bacterium LG25]